MGCTLREKEHPFLINQYEVLGEFSFICSAFLLYSHQSNGKKEVLYDRCEENILVGRLVGYLLSPLHSEKGRGGAVIGRGAGKGYFCRVFSFSHFQSTLSCTRIKPKLTFKRALIEA